MACFLAKKIGADPVSKKRIITIGGAMRDLFLQSSHVQTMCLSGVCESQPFVALQEGRKIEIESLQSFPGGGAVNSAFSFAKQGHAVDIFCKTGSDSEGDFVSAALHAEGVETKHILKDAHEGTGLSIIIPCASGNRTALVYRGANAKLTQEEISSHVLKSDLLKNRDLVYITTLAEGASQALPAIAQEAKRNNALVAVNPGTSQLTKSVATLKAALPNIDILIMNKYEATLLMSAVSGSISGTDFTLENFFTEILKRGPQIVVVTNDKEGVYVASREPVAGMVSGVSVAQVDLCPAHIYFQPSVKTHIISTLGAGDAFGSTFTGYILEGASILDAMRAGVVNAASVLSSLGANTGLLTQSELDESASHLNKAELQTFSF